MNIEQFCEYLNEIGILEMRDLTNFLTNTTNLICLNNKNNPQNKIQSINEIFKISLFNHLRFYTQEDSLIFTLSGNIIKSFKQYQLIKKYNSLLLFRKILSFKILQRFSYFFYSLIKKFKFKNNQNYKYQKNTLYQNSIQKNNNSINSSKTREKSLKTYINKTNNSKINNNSNIISSNNKCTNNNNRVLYTLINYSPSPITKKNLNTDIYSSNTESYFNKNIYNNSNNNNSTLILNNKIFKDPPCLKKSPTVNNNICIQQANFNYDKLLINKKLCICRKFEQINNKNKKLKKNKSESRLKLYDEEIRQKNFAALTSNVAKNLKKRAKSKEEFEFYQKEKQDNILKKLTEKEIDKKNWLDRLYRKEIIEMKKQQQIKNEKDKKNQKKPPVDWDKVYLETNKKIIERKRSNFGSELNTSKKENTCYNFRPNKSKLLEKCHINNKIKNDNNINNNISINNLKDNKIINKVEENEIKNEPKDENKIVENLLLNSNSNKDENYLNDLYELTENKPESENEITEKDHKISETSFKFTSKAFTDNDIAKKLSELKKIDKMADNKISNEENENKDINKESENHDNIESLSNFQPEKNLIQKNEVIDKINLKNSNEIKEKEMQNTFKNENKINIKKEESHSPNFSDNINYGDLFCHDENGENKNNVDNNEENNSYKDVLS